MNLRSPPARVHFPEEDREAILRQIDEAQTGMKKTVEWFKLKYGNRKAALAAAS